MEKTGRQVQDIESEDEIATYTAKQSGYHSIYCLFYLSQSDIWIDTYAKKNGNMLPDFQTRTSTYLYNFVASFNAFNVYLEEGDTFSLHCDRIQALDYITLSVELKNDSSLENNGDPNKKVSLQKTGEKNNFL